MLKRIAAAFLSAGALLGSALCVNAAEADTNNAANIAIKLGDADGNNAVNAVDASIILSNYARYSTSTDKPTDYELITQDVNSDGLVNAVDASIVLSYYAYTSIGGTFTLPEYLKNPNEAPTESVTATTTAAAAATTTTTTTQTTTEPVTYEYTLENITQSAEVFNYFAEKMNSGIFCGRSVTTPNLNGEWCTYNGKMESKVALLLLNENANFKDGVLRDVFAGYNNDSIKEGILYCYRVPFFEERCNGEVDFKKYVLDQNVSDYMNLLENAKRNGASTGDYSELNNILEDVLYNEQYEYAMNNMAALYYTLGTGVYCPGSKYKGDCLEVVDQGNFCGRQSQTENKVKELIK